MSSREYPRTARLNELLREIIADELGQIDDDRLNLVSVTGVDVDNELRRARVYLDVLGEPDDALEAIEEHRGRLRSACGRARIKRAPELVFSTDPGIEAGARVEEILRQLKSEEGSE